MKQVLLIYIIIALFAIGFVEGIPAASFNEPTDSGIITRNYILYNFTAFDDNLKNASIYLYDNTSTIIQQLNKDAFVNDIITQAQTGGFSDTRCHGTRIQSKIDGVLLNVTFYASPGLTLYLKTVNPADYDVCYNELTSGIINANYEVIFNYNITSGTKYCICAYDGGNLISYATGSNALPESGINVNFISNVFGGSNWVGLKSLNTKSTTINFDGSFLNLSYGDYILNGQAYNSFDDINATDNISVSYLCIPDWISSTTSCINDQQLITYTDNSSCGTEAPVDNGTMIICGATKVVNIVNKSFISLLVILIILSVIMGILLYTQALSDEASKIIIPIFIFAISAVCIIMMVIAFGALKALS